MYSKPAMAMSYVTYISISGAPSSVMGYVCKLDPHERGGLEQLSLHWSPSFNAENFVDKYELVMTPDPSSCSSDQVDPYRPFICPRLPRDTTYSINVTAVNCITQAGGSNSFLLELQCMHLYDRSL